MSDELIKKNDVIKLLEKYFSSQEGNTHRYILAMQIQLMPTQPPKEAGA